MHLLIRLAREHFRPFKKHLIVVIILSCLATSQGYIFGLFGKIVVDDILQIGQDVEPQRPPSEKKRLILVMFSAYIATHCAVALASWVTMFLLTKVGTRLVYDLRRRLNEKILSLHMAFFDQRQPGKIFARIIDDVATLQESISTVVLPLVTSFLQLAIGLTILFIVEWRLAIVVCLTLPFYAGSYAVLTPRIKHINRSIRKHWSALYGVAAERLAGIRVVRSFGSRTRETHEFRTRCEKVLNAVMRNAINSGLLHAVLYLASGAGTALSLVIGASYVRSGVLSLGSLLLFYNSVFYLFNPLIKLTSANIQLQMVSVILSRIYHFLDMEPLIKDSPTAVEIPHLKGNVVFENVSLKYESSRQWALKDVSFEVKPGQLVALVGPSGSGKSTLVSLLLRLYDPTEGRILIDGYDIREVKLSCLRRAVRLVPQEPILFRGTIAENIRYGNLNATPRQVVEAARQAELHQFIWSLPGKYEAPVEEGGTNLSGGQKQRIAFAMALLTNPSILILDDTTSALDAETEARIRKTLERIRAGKTCFMITHRLASAARADFILVLEGGRLIEKGTHQELLTRGGLYARMYQEMKRQAEVGIR